MELFFRWFFGLGVFALGLGWLLIYFFLEIVRIHIRAKAGERGEHAEGRRVRLRRLLFNITISSLCHKKQSLGAEARPMYFLHSSEKSEHGTAFAVIIGSNKAVWYMLGAAQNYDTVNTNGERRR